MLSRVWLACLLLSPCCFFWKIFAGSLPGLGFPPIEGEHAGGFNISEMHCANADISPCNGTTNLWRWAWSSCLHLPSLPSLWALGVAKRSKTTMLSRFPSSAARGLIKHPLKFLTGSRWPLWELDWAHRHGSKSIPREAVFMASGNWELGIPCSFPNLRAPARAYKVLEPCQEANWNNFLRES